MGTPRVEAPSPGDSAAATTVATPGLCAQGTRGAPRGQQPLSLAPAVQTSGSLCQPARPPALGAGVSYLSGPSLPSTSFGSQGCGREML